VALSIRARVIVRALDSTFSDNYHIGVPVDARFATVHANIWAIGDCATVSSGEDRATRIESVQNATASARVVTRAILGKEPQAKEMPWFWSDQGDNKLQMVGQIEHCDDFVVRGSPDTGAFSVFGYRVNRLTYVESLNCPQDHLGARELLNRGAHPAKKDIINFSIPLQELTTMQVH
jgi:3-phenylpropionate/trans-cinnamate dioxygenase ferredoxin reductase subunit